MASRTEDAPLKPTASPAQSRSPRLPRRERRSQLLEAAQQVFVAQGYHAAAMDDIAERAGVSKPVLYQHFPGKLELYLALLDHHVESLLAGVRTAMAATTDNRQRVRGAMQAYFDFTGGEDSGFRIVFETDLRNDPAVRERVERAEQGCRAAIADTIMTDTGVDRSDAELLAAGLIGAAEVSARYWLGSNAPQPKERAVDMLATLTWRGISGYPLHN